MTEAKTKLFQPLTLDRPARYQIEIQGQLDQSWSANFGGMTISTRAIPGDERVTTLRGMVADQSTLHGMLNVIRDLGLPLLKVECLSTIESRSQGVNIDKNVLVTIFKGIAFAMGTAVIVLNVIGMLTVTTGLSLLGIGVTVLALGSMLKKPQPHIN